MEELIGTIVKALVDHPDEVHIEKVENNHSITYQLKVHGDDMGKVIGKQGRIAKSIRTVINAAGTNEKKKINLEIV
ncbi:KH domain-containing protein [Pseudalkalibacillus decolorationis]|uniref:KH domain-containing protein n=1 Tax=Pseudalkalibacillus decolorationis TaxID=163879 RepID=UPI002148AAE1|nr:KH domain-containing protein [Pseudalkalibacillus decolorationis]